MMAATAFMAAASVLLAVAVAASDAAEKCAERVDLSSRLAIDSRRNASGHWESKVEMTHSDEGDANREPWKLDVRQVSTDCVSGDSGFLHLTATLISPRAASLIPAGKSYEFVRALEAGGARYTLSVTKASWAEARAVCRRRGGDLLVLDSQREVDAVAPLLRSLPLYPYANAVAHIGFLDRDREGHYVTVRGEPLEYVQWASGNPHGARPDIEDCGGIDKDGRLHDVPCQDQLRFMCEETLAN